MTARDVFVDVLTIAAANGTPRGPLIAWAEDRTAVVPSDADFIELTWTGNSDGGLFLQEDFHADSALLRETQTMVRVARVTLLCKAWFENAGDLLERIESALWGRACRDALNAGRMAIIDAAPIMNVTASYSTAQSAASRDLTIRYFITRVEDIRAEEGFFDEVNPPTGTVPGVAPGDAR